MHQQQGSWLSLKQSGNFPLPRTIYQFEAIKN